MSAERLLLGADDFQDLLDSSPDIIARFDREFRHVYVNRAVTQATGIPAEEFIGKTNAELGLDESLVRFWHAHLEQVFRTGRDSEIEFSYDTPAGPRFFHSRLAPEFGGGRAVEYVVAVARDITQRKKAQEATLRSLGESLKRQIAERLQTAGHLHDSERRYFTVIESLNQGIVQTDAAGAIIFANTCFCDMVGYSLHELVGRTSAEVLLAGEEDAQLIREKMRLRRQGVSEHYEVRMRRKSGEVRWIAVSAAPLEDERGNYIGSIGIHADVTERKLAEEQLRESERLLAESQLVAQLGSWQWDIPASRVTWSANLYRLTGMNPDEPVSFDTFLNLIHPDDREFVAAEVKQALANIKPFDCDFRIVRPDGAVRFFATRGEVIDDEPNRPARMIGTAQDITERKMIEAAEREQRALAESLNETAAAIGNTLDLNEVLGRILETVGRVVPHDSANIMLVESGRARVVRRISANEQYWPKPPSANGLPLDDFPTLREMARTRLPLAIADTGGSEDRSPEASAAARSYVGAPILNDGQVIGFINLHSGSANFYAPSHASRLQAFANQAALAIKNAHLFEEVRSSRERLRALSLRLVEVQESERSHLSRELHDQIGQVLTGLKHTLELAAASDPASRDAASLREAQQSINELIQQVRTLSLDLRPALLDDLGLLPALQWHIHRYTAQHHIEVNFQHTGIEGRRFPIMVETAAFRIVQEAMTNVARHANKESVTVRCWADGAAVGVQIEDRGPGFDPAAALSAAGTRGLAGMRERAELLGGALTIDATRGSGTRLTAELPLPAADGEAQ